MLIHSSLELALLIKNQRKKLKLSQAEVAALVGLKQKTISAIENNPEHMRLSTLFRILSALDLDLKISAKSESNTTNNQWNDEW
ncbi:helix-turn-helix domain-containing protein [Legionella anisa]|uniref:Transcriptional regulator n=1 Tax=Legionella anisa TaxID=28082 RepID=A0AAX0WST7_9GAMM|nr:helix-turn-helix domain-containing protein [Legionella anisa]AWN74697.1 helix-turn-helix domain-containing protein [Legionella anisa]KTC77493.1 putative DNA-binding transcriptional regulator [Legionella anisa]MBN5935894.1 helix-turn-helix domain-containing protein [Legionella anisa]MCW8425182.1 helix-turn-helix domain-containing protein [Legionella anisa]MCW8449396.1 helix-turn-helix domain-containing protein [Legionella anisa]